MNPEWMQEICANCGCTFGSHYGRSSLWPNNYCPGHEGRMDWEEGPGTCFKPTGKYKEKIGGEKRTEENIK